MNCTKCNDENLNFYNYCKNDGEDLNNSKENLTLKSNISSNCTECGASLISQENYCSNCGKSLVKIAEQNQISTGAIKEGTLKKSLNINLQKLKFNDLNLKSILLSVGLTIILTGLALVLLNSIIKPESLYGDNYDLYMDDYQNLMPSKFKSFMYNLVFFNLPTINVSLKMALTDFGRLSMSIRVILYPLMIILCTYISTRVCLNKKTSKENTLETSIVTAIIYSIIIALIGLFSSFNITEDGVTLSISYNIITLFINSLIIGLIGSYLGISKNKELGITDVLFRKSMKLILLGFAITSIIIACVLYYGSTKEPYVSSLFTPYFDNISKSVMLIGGIITLACYVFTLSNIASISVFGITSFSIFSLSSKLNNPALLLITLIPIVLLILTGRKLKHNYGENLKIAATFSGMYTLFMIGFAYSTRFVLSIDGSQVQSFLDEFLYGFFSIFSYDLADTVVDYLNQVYSSLSSGVYFGPNIISVAIATFILSFVCIFIGYKTKKINQI